MEQIRMTYEYSLFSFLEGNRAVSRKNVLVKSIAEIDLTKYKPILVDALFRIIDGQHRFEACRELNKPIYYMVVCDKDVKKSLIALNAHQKMWRQEEYFSFFESDKGGSYSDMKAFMEKHEMSITNAAVVFPRGQINSTIIKSGEMSLEENEHSNDIGEFLSSENIKSLRFSRTRPFVLSVRKAFERYTKKQMDKLNRNSLKIPQCANYQQYLTVFANIIKA